MAQLTFTVTRAGLAVPVWVGLDGKTTAPLFAAGLPVPPPIGARGLLDTGSNVTAVAGWILRQLGISKLLTASTTTAGGSRSVDLYEVSFGITDPNQPGSPSLTESDLLVMELPATLPDADVLIGLDVLLKCHLFLNGRARRFVLDF